MGFISTEVVMLHLSPLVLVDIGEVVGASSFSVGHGVNTLKKVASVRMFHQSPDGQHIMSYPLRRKVSAALGNM